MTDVESFMCKIVSWKEITEWTKNVVQKMKDSGFNPNVVIALIRGGLVPARLICDHLHQKNLYAVKVEHWGITAQTDMQAKLVQGLDLDLSGKKILVVDDITDTGESMRLATEHLKEKGPSEMRSATLLHIAHSKFEPDFFDVFVPEDEWTWFIFPWNFHEDLRTLCGKTLTVPKSIEEIRASLKKQFEIIVDKDTIEGAMIEMHERGDVTHDDGMWEKME
jgi:hypoxanthine phosphoribosyltransferase